MKSVSVYEYGTGNELDVSLYGLSSGVRPFVEVRIGGDSFGEAVELTTDQFIQLVEGLNRLREEIA